MPNATGRWVLLVVAVALGATAIAYPATGYAQGKSSFPCHWKWDLQAGLRNGYVTAANSARCGGRSGSLTLSARLLRWDPESKTWQTDRAQTRTWKNLRGNRYVALAEPCAASTVRAVFGWILRNPRGSIVARHTVKTGSLKVPGPDCKTAIG